MSAVLVTIGIPTRNRVDRLERALESALGQEGVELEVVVSDNASTDGTPELLERTARTDPRLRWIRQPADVGAEANFRAVLDRATTPLFMWLADDDWVDPGYVAACAGLLAADPAFVLVGGRAVYYREGAVAFREPRPVDLRSSSPLLRVLRYYATVSSNGIFYGVARREVLARVGPRTGVGSDWVHVAALAAEGKVATLEDVEIHRSAEGASRDERSLMRAYGLRPGEARGWYMLVARAARAEIRQGAGLDRVPGPARAALGATITGVVVARFGPRAVVASLLERLGLLERARSSLERRRR